MSLPIPQKGLRIYDLLKMAGMSLSRWPHANSPYLNQCWAWLEGDVAVVNVWMDNIRHPTELKAHYSTSYQARGQNHKGHRTDEIYKEIIRKGLRVHVILKERTTSKRILDTELWCATYDESTGVLTLVRGEANQYEDQHGDFSVETEEIHYEVSRRSRFLRLRALERSRGICEYCGEPGFRTPKGTVFAEVHHIQPLKEDGPDSLDNLVVLCPNDHRRAHHSTERDKMKILFLKLRESDRYLGR